MFQLNQAIGSIEAIAKASKEHILENTDLSADKADIITRFFRDPKFYLSPKINWYKETNSNSVKPSVNWFDCSSFTVSPYDKSLHVFQLVDKSLEPGDGSLSQYCWLFSSEYIFLWNCWLNFEVLDLSYTSLILQTGKLGKWHLTFYYFTLFYKTLRTNSGLRGSI